MEYLSGVVGAVISNFNALKTWQQAIYVMYIMSGLFGPWQTYKQARIYERSNDGIGSTCVRNMVKQMLWRIPPFTASWACFQYLIFPLFMGVLFDIIARCHVIRAAIKARDRAEAARNVEASNDEQFEGELDAA